MNVVLGQYLPGTSILHKLDPRIKILSSFFLMIVVFVVWGSLPIAIITVFTSLLVAISSISIKTYIKSAGLILIMAVISAFLNLFYAPGEPIFEFFGISITELGIKNSIFSALRVFNMIIISSCFMFTTSPSEMTHGMRSLMKPLRRFNFNVDDLIIMITISLRFIPITLEEVNKIMNAQKSRGADINRGGLIKKVKSFIPVILPLFISTFRRAYDLAMAMECRCYGLKPERTCLKKLSIGLEDGICICFVILFMIGVVLCNNKSITNLI